ncbi:DUF6544 family protein [Pedobacter sp. Du54]|uniref:DUF6920 family protein n=1 Tax=Pedobacter anseongensis TaxID=3133439 RepID=UPI00309D8270
MDSLKSLFSLELKRARALVKKIYTGKRKVDELPNALQHFVQQSGFITQGDIHETKVEWKATKLKFSENGKWKLMESVQHNFLPDPIRLAYMKTKLFGLFTLEGFDSFRHGKGGMFIRMARLFNLARAQGPEIDKAELATILAETMIIPDYALQRYIHWEELSKYVVKGTIDYHGLKASGIFFFNTNFEINKFETNDRYFTDKKGIFHPVKWTAECSSYVTHGGIRFPTFFNATWNFSHRDFCYFQGSINDMIINP